MVKTAAVIYSVIYSFPQDCEVPDTSPQDVNGVISGDLHGHCSKGKPASQQKVLLSSLEHGHYISSGPHNRRGALSC